MTTCYKCKEEIKVDKIIGRKDICPFCKSELRCCKNCRHYDPMAYNQCRETQADRVLEKDRSNFCDYFVFTVCRPDEKTKEIQQTARNKLEDLFKK